MQNLEGPRPTGKLGPLRLLKKIASFDAIFVLGQAGIKGLSPQVS